MRTGVALLLGWLPAMANASEAVPASELPPPSADLLTPPTRTPDLPFMHPPVVVRDQSGRPVVESDQPASARQTCDPCHDVAWIETHNNHAMALRKLGQGPDGIGCFVCHVHGTDARPGGARTQWDDSATLAGLGLATRQGDRWQWRKDLFAADGSIPASKLRLGRPSDQACGYCHGRVDHGHEPIGLTFDPSQRMTDAHGIIFSGQRISDSAINLAGKDGLTRPWDVHAERMVSCASCHYSPNHPAYAWATQAPAHLQFDARRSAITEYLRRPDHRLARGMTGDTDASGQAAGTIRRCESCHDASRAHGWLPRAQRHFAAMLCETCHIPAAYLPARQETDWTMLTASRLPRVTYRGVRADGFVTGFHPALLPRALPDGSRKLAPHNLTTSWFWTEQTSGGRQRVGSDVLERAFFAGDAHKPELVRALDRNGDGRLADEELILDSEPRRDLARDLLVAAGVEAPQIVGEVAMHAMRHGVSPGRFATRDCSACHARDSRLTQPFVLTSAVPFGAMPGWRDGRSPQADAELIRDGNGRLLLSPNQPRLHVFGHTKSSLVDGLGVFLFASALAGVAAHGLLRVRSRRQRKKDRP
jgi:hypothetical protein